MGARDPRRESMGQLNVINGCSKGSAQRGVPVRRRDRTQGNGELSKLESIHQTGSNTIAGPRNFLRSQSRCGCGWQVETNVDFLGRFQVEPGLDSSLVERVLFQVAHPLSGPAASLVQGQMADRGAWLHDGCMAEEGAREARNSAPAIRY